MTILFSILAFLFALIFVAYVDNSLLRYFIPSLGFVFVLMYGVTYGIGLILWRSDPSSLFGYGSTSTIGALDVLLLYFCIGIISLSAAYGICRCLLNRLQNHSIDKTLSELTSRHIGNLANLSYLLVILGVVAIVAMNYLGLFSRTPAFQAQVLHGSIIGKLIIGSSIISRLVPVGFFLIPFVWKKWSLSARFLIIILLSTWQVIAISSGSRGLLISLPVYLIVGNLCWQKISLRRLSVVLFVGVLLFLPVAEQIRVHREGHQSVPELKQTFQTFQIGKQFMGTSHEFYLSLRPPDCRADLTKKLAEDPNAAMIYEKGVRSFPKNSLSRWHVVGLYENCAERVLSHRYFDGFRQLPLGLIPSSFFPDSPSLFDGQDLSERLSHELDLKPGEISYATISLFADSFWRWGWRGLFFAPASVGAFLAILQSLFAWMLSKTMLSGLLAQFLVVTLICTWINNTILTMTWYLFWDFPKSWLELILLSIILSKSRLLRRTASPS